MGETKKNSKATSILKNNPLTSIVKGNIGIIVVLIIMCVAVALATDKFLTTNNIISVLRQISINTYIALGMTLIIILGHIDLSVGSIVAMSGTLTVGFIVNQGLPLGVAIAAGLLVGTAAGFVSGFIVANFQGACIHHHNGHDEYSKWYSLCLHRWTVNTYHKQALHRDRYRISVQCDSTSGSVHGSAHHTVQLHPQ